MRFTLGKLVFVLCLLTGTAAFLAAAGPQGAPPAGAAGGQGGGRGPAAPPENLKVLPKDWSRQQVQQIMQTFVESLGLNPPAGEGCAYCHAPDPNAPAPAAGRGPQMNYALDTKEKKDVARKMMQMTMDINAKTMASLGDAAVKEKVTCFTCHQGKEKPAMTPANGWARGSFTLIPPGPVVPARGAAPGGAPGGGRQ